MTFDQTVVHVDFYNLIGKQHFILNVENEFVSRRLNNRVEFIYVLTIKKNEENTKSTNSVTFTLEIKTQENQKIQTHFKILRLLIIGVKVFKK